MLRTVRKVSSASNLSPNATQGSLPTSPAMRRKRRETECLLKLERVLGLTSNKPMILSVNSTHDMVAYAAGCIVVLYNHKLDKQVGLLCSSTLKKSSPADSGPGSSGTGGMNSRSHGGSPRVGPMSTSNSNQWLNSGFSGANINPLAGLMPMAISDGSVVSSFGTSAPSSNKNVKPKPISCLSFSPDGQFLAIGETGHQPRILIWEVASQTLVGELQGHKFGVQAVQFSPNSKYLVTLGFQHDGYIHVWNWKSNVQIASNKVTTRVNALAFSADGSFFVTAGLRHIKYWYLNVSSSKRVTGAMHNTQVLDGRSGILGELRDGNYVDAVCNPDGRYTYAITSNGVLCSFAENRTLERWVSLHTRGAYSVNLNEDSIICACTDGIIRLFKQETLEYIGTLPKPSPVGSSIELLEKVESNGEEGEAAKPFYSDVLASQCDSSSGSLICIYSDRSLYVWDINDPQNAVASRIHSSHSDCVWGVEIMPSATDNSTTPIYPPDTFLTYSTDGSIIFWNLDESISISPPTSNNKDSESSTQGTNREVLDVLYVDNNCKSWIHSPENIDGDPGFNAVPIECGIRTAKVSADGKLLASGDKGGNLRVHEIPSMKQLTYQEAHENEILAIDFTEPSDDSPFLVATAGRDRLLHVFDVSNDYALVQTLDDHSSSITCIKFTNDGSRMMSCGADKSIVFRNGIKGSEGHSFQPYHQATGRATFYDMGINNESQTISVVAGDRRFNIFTLDSGKSIRSFKAETKGDDLAAGMAEICSMTHISLDPTGTIAAASGSDKSVRVYDLLSGACLAHMICHSEQVTSIKFMNSYDRIISTGGDGCVLIWRLSKEVVRKIQVRIQENVTLPGYLQAKATEKTMSAMAPTPSPRPLRLMKSKDKMGTSLSEYSGTSRRNSTASIVSDYDTRAGELSDDAGENKSIRGSRDSRVDDVPRDAFTPVTASAAGSPITPSTRSRISGSISMTPLSRSRQSSTSNPSTTRLRHASSTQPEQQPQWNRGHIKERVKSSPSASTTTFGTTNPQQLTPKLPVKNWLTPASSRQRATSLTVPTEATLKMDNPKERGRSSERKSLSDYSRDDPPTAPGDDDDDVLSDDTESGFDDGLGFIPDNHRSNVGINEKLRINTKNSRDSIKNAPKSIEKRKSLIVESGPEASETDNVDETGASEGRDGDDEDADEDESISDTGSDNDNDIPSPLRRNLSPILSNHSNPGSPNINIGDLGGFDEGEKIKDSPRSDGSQHVTSPSGRIISIRLAGTSRRSLSSIFLTAHAATTLMGLSRESAGVDIPDNEIKNNITTSNELSHSVSSSADGGPGIADQNTVDNASIVRGDDHKLNVDTLGVSSSTSTDKEISLQEEQDRPLEQRLNLQSLNAAALKWKQRSMSSGSNDSSKTPNKSEREIRNNQQDQNTLDAKAGSSVSLGKKLVNGGNNDNGYDDSQTTRTMEMKFENNKSASFEENRLTSKTHGKSESQSIAGILASPVMVKSPESIISHRSSSRSLGQAMNSLFGSAYGEMDTDRSEKQKSKTEKDDSSEQSLRDAFDRISFLISHKAMTATRIGHRKYVESEKIQDSGEIETDIGARSASAVSAEDIERMKEAKKWMLETREGLLNLVGEVQGHLWALERDKKLEGMEE